MNSPASVRLRLLFLLFFGSGACGLVYQVVWMRALTLTLSVTVYAVTTVLCAFMAGLALGAILAGRIADRLERPLLIFGLVEIGIALTGIAAPRILLGLGPCTAGSQRTSEIRAWRCSWLAFCSRPRSC